MDSIRRELGQIEKAERAEQTRVDALVARLQREADDKTRAEQQAGDAVIAAEAEERRVKAEKELKDRARLAYMSNLAATEQDFEAAWPEMRKEALYEEVLANEAGARLIQQELYRRAW